MFATCGLSTGPCSDGPEADLLRLGDPAPGTRHHRAPRAGHSRSRGTPGRRSRRRPPAPRRGRIVQPCLLLRLRCRPESGSAEAVEPSRVGHYESCYRRMAVAEGFERRPKHGVVEGVQRDRAEQLPASPAQQRSRLDDTQLELPRHGGDGAVPECERSPLPPLVGDPRYERCGNDHGYGDCRQGSSSGPPRGVP